MKKFLILLSIVLLAMQTYAQEDVETPEDIILNSMKNKSKKDLFKVYHFLYNKDYSLNSEEAVKRYKIFKNNLKHIDEVNAEGLSYKLGINQFADLTFEEFKQTYLNISEEEHERIWEGLAEEKLNFDFLADQDDELDNFSLNSIPSAKGIVRDPIDWRNHTAPVRDQGRCGSCWAFASAGTSETNLYLKSNFTTPFHLSPQYLVDCDNQNGAGCDGGYSYGSIGNYIVKNGIVRDSDYPYDSYNGTSFGKCRLNPNMTIYKPRSADVCTNCDIDTWYLFLSKGPIAISSYVDTNFQLYKSGVYEIKACTSKSSNHAIVAVGWGNKNVNGTLVEYTVIRNSWSSRWGENGHMRIKYQPELNKSCFINMRAARPNF